MNFSNLLKNNEDIIDQEARRTMEKLENCVIKVDFWPDLHEICDCYGNVNYWSSTHNGDIKISAADKWKTTESFKLLEWIAFEKIWKKITGGDTTIHHSESGFLTTLFQGRPL